MFNPIPLPRLKAEPFVSILVANYNYGRFLPGAVESILRQTYQSFEIIVCDDGSRDGSKAVLSRLVSRDRRVKALYKENGGQTSAWNRAYQHARGDVICLLDPDDRFRPEKLAEVVAAFRASENAGLVYDRSQVVGLDGRPLGGAFPGHGTSGWLLKSALAKGGRGAELPTSQLSFRREFADLIFPLPETLTFFGDGYIQGVAQFVTEIVALEAVLTERVFHNANHSASIGHLDLTRTAAGVEGYKLVFDETSRFVERRFGSEMAEHLRLEDIPGFWEQLSVLYILSGKPTDGVAGYAPSEIAGNLVGGPRKRLWRLLFSLPSPLAQWTLQIWWSNGWWKRIVRPLAAYLRLRSINGVQSQYGPSG